MLRDPFNPNGGTFADNIRSTVGDDLTELVESLKEHGWVPEFPALVDENGVVLVGHRRMKAAEIAGIEPVIKRLMLGQGDAGDAERLRLAIVSNIGAKPLSKQDRQRIAQHLYGSREWTMQRIAHALNASSSTIHADLVNFSVPEKLGPHTKTARNPKGAGRPRKQAAKTEIARPTLRAILERGETVDRKALGKELGLTSQPLKTAEALERGRLEGLAEAAERGQIDPSVLSKTAHEKLAAFEKRTRAQLEAEFEQRVRAEVDRRLAERDARDDEAIAQANELISHESGRRRPPFSPQEYYQLLWALHPDSNDPAKATAAFVMVRQKKLILCDEGPIKRKSDNAAPLPKTAADLVRVKRTRKAAA